MSSLCSFVTCIKFLKVFILFDLVPIRVCFGSKEEEGLPPQRVTGRLPGKWCLNETLTRKRSYPGGETILGLRCVKRVCSLEWESVSNCVEYYGPCGEPGARSRG